MEMEGTPKLRGPMARSPGASRPGLVPLVKLPEPVVHTIEDHRPIGRFVSHHRPWTQLVPRQEPPVVESSRAPDAPRFSALQLPVASRTRKPDAELSC